MTPPLLWRCTAVLAACALQAGCSIVSPAPLWELAKLTGTAVSASVALIPISADSEVFRLEQKPELICIEYNPLTQVPDILPAIQTELRQYAIDSRVYDTPSAARQCEVWLEYSAYFDYGRPAFSTEPQSYVHTVQMTLRNRSGQVLSASSFNLGKYLSRGQWTDTRSKVRPVVATLLTGNRS